MAKTTKISWTATRNAAGILKAGSTFNAWIGCWKVSPGCEHCYADTQDKHYHWTADGWGHGKPRHRTSPSLWREPLKWQAEAMAEGRMLRIFSLSLGDFLDPEVDPAWRHDLFDLINETGTRGPIEWLLLTKRIEYAAEMLPADWLANPPVYVRLGVSVENQEYATRRIPELIRVWKGLNFISYEPALSEIDFTPWLNANDNPRPFAGRLHGPSALDWIIYGGESGPNCREAPLDWAFKTRDDCAAVNVPFFFKQVGGHPDKRDDPISWPYGLRVRQLPEDLSYKTTAMGLGE